MDQHSPSAPATPEFNSDLTLDATPSPQAGLDPEAAVAASAEPREPHVVITIGRQFGSGGRELGRMIAEAFGYDYYDKELLSQAAERAGMSREFFEKNDERFPSFLSGVFSFAFGFTPGNYYAGTTSISDDSLYRAQSDFIQSLADRGPCVIVGRSADYVLREHPRRVSIFVHCPMEERVRRIVSRSPELTPEKARAKAEKINRLRSSYYNFYTDKTWGAAESYDLSIDTSLLPMQDIVEVVRTYVKRRFRME